MSKSGIPPWSSASRASPRRTASRQASIAAELRSDVEMDPAPADRSVGAAAGLDDGADLVRVNAELRAPRSGREAGVRLGLDRRVEPHERIDAQRREVARLEPARRPRARRRAVSIAGASAAASSADSTATQRSGSPAAAARTAARRSASVLPIPSSVIAAFGTPARRASAHSPRDTTLAPKPRAASRATSAGRSFAFSE